MKSFQDLGLSAPLIEALAAAGMASPFELQQNIIPLIAKNNNLLVESGPGSGTLIAYAAALLEKIEPGLGSPGAIILTPTKHSSARLAQSISRLSSSTGHSVSALGGNWASPETSDILFGTPHELLAAINNSLLTTQNIATLVVDGANSLEVTSDLDSVRELLGYIGNTTQKIIFSLPVTNSVKQIVTRYIPKCLEISGIQKQPVAVNESRPTSIYYLIATEDREEALLSVLNQHLAEISGTLMVFVHTNDRAVDVVNFLKMYGFTAGTPGDTEARIWVGMDDQNSYSQIAALSKKQSLTTLSLDCPQDTIAMHERHGGARGAIVLLLSREVPHFHKITSDLSYNTQPLHISTRSQRPRLKEVRTQLIDQITSQDLAPYYAILEPLIEIYDPIELSAASLSLASLPRNSEENTKNQPPLSPDNWTRLFVSIGKLEEITPSTLLGVLAGESGVDGSAFGKIDIRETFSLVEVMADEAGKVIKAVNGVTIRGRSTRVDYDRSLTDQGSQAIKR